MVRARNESSALNAAWSDFVERVRTEPVPYHLTAILSCLQEVGFGRPKDVITILDHGCGGALSTFYLAAHGYTRVYGVDIGGDFEDRNAVARLCFGAEEQRYFVYDGTRLPFSDSHFDLVFSEQVVEHIRPRVLERYYAEEARVMKQGAVAFHRVPHRLVPYDSHTQTWLIHYLPRGWWLWALRLLRRDLTTAETALYLRWPWVHRHLAQKYLGNYADCSMDRFNGVSDLSVYDGPRGLRQLLGVLVRVPGLGSVFGALLGNFIMLDTISRKSD